MSQKRIKVLIGVNDLTIGGVQRLALDQLQRLDKEIFDLTLVVLLQFPDKGNFYDRVPKGVRIFKLNFKSIFDVREWLVLWNIVRKIKPDIVKSSLFFSNIIFGFLKPFFGYRLITAEHNTEDKKTSFQIFLNRILMHFAETMVVDSNMVADYLSKTEKIRRDKYTVIYNGVDIDAIQKAKIQYEPQKLSLRQEFSLHPNDKVFLNIARLNRQKDHELMVNAFANLSRMRDDCCLIIIGDGKYRESLKKQIADLGLEKKVFLMGERKDIEKFYAISDFFLLTSRHEGFCITAMQGLAFGLPLISTRVAGVSEYLEDDVNGFFVQPDPADIAEKMNKVANFSEEQRNVFSKNGMETAKKYSVERYIQTYSKIFYGI